MQPNQPPAMQGPQAPTTRPISRRLVLSAVGVLLFIVLFALLPLSFQFITFVTYNSKPALSSTSTSSNSVVDKANDALSKADQESAQTQNLLTQITSFASVLGLILALFAVVTVGLGVYGFSTNTGFHDLETQWREQLAGLGKLQQETESKGVVIDKLLAGLGKLQQETESKGVAIDKLQDEMRQKQQEIDRLQAETEQKQQGIDALQQRLETLKEKMEDEVASVELHVETINTALTILGNQFLEQRQRKQAIEIYERAQQLKPGDPQINFALGRAYSGEGLYDKAITYLDIAATVDEHFPQAQMELGLAYRRRGNMLYEVARHHAASQAEKENLQQRAKADYTEAAEHLDRAIRLRPEYEDALAVLGGLYRRLEQYDLALQSYAKAADADPKSSYALGNVASLLWYVGKKQEALVTFSRVKEVARERIDKLVKPAELYWDYYDLALAQLALGETEEAETNYRIAIERTPGPVEFEGVLSNLYLLRKADYITGLEKIIKMVEQAESASQGK